MISITIGYIFSFTCQKVMWKHTCLQIRITETKGLSSLVIFYMVMRDSFALGICEWYVYVEYADQNGNKTAKKT